jgi:hypothetical protein
MAVWKVKKRLDLEKTEQLGDIWIDMESTLSGRKLNRVKTNEPPKATKD